MSAGHPRWVGAKVRLLRDVRTNGGQVFRAGCVMRVVDRTSGGLYLRAVTKRGVWLSITRVQVWSVELLEEGEKPE